MESTFMSQDKSKLGINYGAFPDSNCMQAKGK